MTADEITELKNLCRPAMDYLKEKYPYHSIVINSTDDTVRLTKTVKEVSLFVPYSAGTLVRPEEC